LIYQVYSEQEYVERDPDGIWRSDHNALPGALTLIVRRTGRVVATATIVPDGLLLGLPLERMYSSEVDGLRDQGHRLAEINGLAVLQEEGRAGYDLLLHVFRAGYEYACNILRADRLLAVVSPHHASFYRRLLGFEQLGGLRCDPQCNGAASVALCLDARAVSSHLQRALRSKRDSRNRKILLLAPSEARDLNQWLRFGAEPEPEPATTGSLTG
jgi:hypothetical protein